MASPSGTGPAIALPFPPSVDEIQVDYARRDRADDGEPDEKPFANILSD